MWVLGFMFAVVLMALVYEKQYHLRMMMKMHGLSDSAYWAITYVYYVALFCVYMLCFIAFGSIARKARSIRSCPHMVFCFVRLLIVLLDVVAGLAFFTKNDYSIQFVFYFLYINMIISFASLVSSIFRDAKTATGMSMSIECLH